MNSHLSYTRGERIGLIVVAIVGFTVINGAFLYGVIVKPVSMQEAMANPVSLAFMVEAVLLVPLFAYLFERWGVSRLGWPWFVVLSLLGSIAFAVPVMLLFPREVPVPARSASN